MCVNFFLLSCYHHFPFILHFILTPDPKIFPKIFPGPGTEGTSPPLRCTSSSVMFELGCWPTVSCVPQLFLHFSFHLVCFSGITQSMIVVVWCCPSPFLQKTLADPLELEISRKDVRCVFSKHHLQLWERGRLWGVCAHPPGDWCHAPGACAALSGYACTLSEDSATVRAHAATRFTQSLVMWDARKSLGKMIKYSFGVISFPLVFKPQYCSVMNPSNLYIKGLVLL